MFKSNFFKQRNTKFYSILIASVCVLGVLAYTPSFLQSRESNANFDYFSDIVKELDFSDRISEESGIPAENIADTVKVDRVEEIDSEESLDSSSDVKLEKDNEFILPDGPSAITDGGGNPYLNRWLEVTENEVGYIGDAGDENVDFCGSSFAAFQSPPNIAHNLVYQGTTASKQYHNGYQFCNRSNIRVVNPGQKVVLNIKIPGGLSGVNNNWYVNIGYRNNPDLVGAVPTKITIGSQTATANLTHDPNSNHHKLSVNTMNLPVPGFYSVEVENTSNKTFYMTMLRVKPAFTLTVPKLTIEKTMVGYSQNQEINWDTLPVDKKVSYEVAWNVTDGNVLLGDLNLEDNFMVDGQLGTKIYNYIDFNNISGIAPTFVNFDPSTSTLKWKITNAPANVSGKFKVNFSVNNLRTAFGCSETDQCGPFTVVNKATADFTNDMFLPISSIHTVKYISPAVSNPSPFTITKTVDKATLTYPRDGGSLTYTITVKNNSGESRDAFVEDSIPQIGNTGLYVLPKVYPKGTVSSDNRKVFWRFENALGNAFLPNETKILTLKVEIPGSVQPGLTNAAINNLVKVSSPGLPDKTATALTILNVPAMNYLVLENYQVARPAPEYLNVQNGVTMTSGLTAHSFTLRVVTTGGPLSVQNILIPLSEIRTSSLYNGGAIDPETIRIISPSSGATYDYSAGYFTVSSVSSNAPLTITFNAYYNINLGAKSVPNNQESQLQNEVKIYSTGNPGLPFYNNALPITVALKGMTTASNLVATKAVTPLTHSFALGTTPSDKIFTYTISVQNTGTANANNLTVVDTLPVGISTIGLTSSHGGSIVGRTIVWNGVNINAGATWTANISAPVETANSLFSSAGTYSLQNNVRVEKDGTTVASASVISFVDVTGNTPLNFDVTKSVNKASALNGETVNYTVTVQNRTNMVGSVIVKDTIGNNGGTIPGTNGGYLTFNSQYNVSLPNGARTEGSLMTTTGAMVLNIPPQGIVTFTYGTTVTIPTNNTGLATNTVVLASPSGQQYDTDSKTVTLGTTTTTTRLTHKRHRSNINIRSYGPYVPYQEPIYYSDIGIGTPVYDQVLTDLSIRKNVSPSRVDSGKEVTYTVDIKNTTADFKVINVYDSLGVNGDGIVTGDNGSKISYIKNSLKVNGSNFTGDIDNYEGLSLLDVEPNETITITYRALATGNGSVTNEVSLTDGEFDKATLEISGPRASNTQMSITKSADKNQVRPNDTVGYSLKVTNNTGSNAKSVNIKDALPAGLDFISSPNSELRANGNNLEIDLGDMAPGESKIIKYYARVGSDVRRGQTLPNEAGLTYTDENNNPVGPIYARELVSVGGKVLFILFVLFTAVSLVKIVRLGRARRTATI